MNELSEKSLEDLIFESASEKYSRAKLKKHGLQIDGKLYRQVELGIYGRLDLVSVCIGGKEKDGKRTIIIDVYELKKVELKVDTLLQAVRYLSCIRSLFSDDDIKDKFNFVWKITLIGSSIDDESDFCRLLSFLNKDVRVFVYDVNLDGIFFKEANKTEEVTNFEILYRKTDNLHFSDYKELLNVIPTDMPF